MKPHSTIIIGAGQCGLAMSRLLTERSIEHVILERGEVANSWRKERWDSLRLLTPNWLNRLPGSAYQGPDPNGYMTMPEIVSRFSGYAEEISAPIRTGIEVLRVSQDGLGYRVQTSEGPLSCTTLVLATGACNIASVPRFASEAPKSVKIITPIEYKLTSDLPGGGVLVVGGSATGVQLARELQLSGRQVILSTGEHVRVPRTYRGRDIKWWMEGIGILGERYNEVDDLARVRRTPSLQLAGIAETIDLNALKAIGVEVVGRLASIRDSKAIFSGGLANHCMLADLKMNRLLDLIDAWVGANGLNSDVEPVERFPATTTAASPRLDLDLTSGEIRSIVWATGFRPDYSWLDLPVLDRKRRLIHDGGIVAPGLYAMGLPFMRRRKSTLIDGAGEDARELVDHMASELNRQAA
jgi:putative flavoprotein involved in K+ transport